MASPCYINRLLTGDPPYINLSAMSALFAIVQDDQPPLPEGCSPVRAVCGLDGWHGSLTAIALVVGIAGLLVAMLC